VTRDEILKILGPEDEKSSAKFSMFLQKETSKKKQPVNYR
jgi:hypothetical protein